MTEPAAFPLAHTCPSPPPGALSTAQKADPFWAASKGSRHRPRLRERRGAPPIWPPVSCTGDPTRFAAGPLLHADDPVDTGLYVTVLLPRLRNAIKWSFEAT